MNVSVNSSKPSVAVSPKKTNVTVEVPNAVVPKKGNTGPSQSPKRYGTMRVLAESQSCPHDAYRELSNLTST
jgi:hypothetical protein